MTQYEGKMLPAGIDKVTLGDATLWTGSCLDVLPLLPADSVHCVVTSPPYWGLRDYGTAEWEGGSAECEHKTRKNSRDIGTSGLEGGKQNCNHELEGYHDVCRRCGAVRVDRGIGLEPTFQDWLDRMVAVMREVRRVLRPDGVCWVNCGDAYVGSNNKAVGDMAYKYAARGTDENVEKSIPGLQPKQLMMMPARLAIALQADGWWVRSEVIWAKPNPMPESVTDRPTSAHEKVYLLTKSAKYFYDADAVREPHDRPDLQGKSFGAGKIGKAEKMGSTWEEIETREYNPAGRNLRNVWTIPTQPFPESHFATFPEELARRCIAAGTSEQGCCPKCGAQWERVMDYKANYGRREPAHAPNNCPSKVDSSEWKEPTREHLGWQPTCACGLDPVPATVLDPFSGAATTGFVALKLGRRYIGIELSAEYNEMALRRIEGEARQVKLF